MTVQRAGPKRRKRAAHVVQSPRDQATRVRCESEREPLSIVSWNLENIVPYLGPMPARRGRPAAPVPGLAAIAQELGAPDVLCLQEVRLRPTDAELIAKARSALPGYECGLALSDDARNAGFRGGRTYGVATYTRRELGAQHRTFSWDKEGRVLLSTLPRHRLALINVYAVNGTAKPYFDHELGRFAGDRHAFKRRFNERLMDECAKLCAQGWALVLIGDFNISRSELDTFPRLRTEGPHALARKQFNEQFMPGLGVVDVFRHCYPDARAYTWFNRMAPPGTLDAARVDFALISEQLLAHVQDVGIHAEPSRRHRSDHAPLYLRLGLLRLVEAPESRTAKISRETPSAFRSRAAFVLAPPGAHAPKPKSSGLMRRFSGSALSAGTSRGQNLGFDGTLALRHSSQSAMTLRLCTDNPRYFCDAAGEPIYLTGSHTWNNLQDLGEPFDYERYLERMLELGHNFARLWVFEQACGLQWAQRQRDAVVEPQIFVRVGPAAANDGRPRFDLTQINPAFLELLHARVAAAAARGIYVSVMLFMGFSVTNCDKEGVPWRFHPFHRDNNVNGVDGDPGRREDGALTHTLELPRVTRLQEAYVRSVVEKLNAFDNVLFEVSNESPPGSTGFQAHIIEFVRQVERSLPKLHPIGMTFQWEGGSNRTLFESQADWVSPNSEGGFADAPPSAAFGKVVISDTDHLWGVGGSVEWVWKTFCRGHQPIFMDPWEDQLYTTDTWRGPIEPEPIRRAMGQTRRVAQWLDLRRAQPRPDLASSAYCLADEGAAYVVFEPGATNVELHARQGRYRLRWLHPWSGEELGAAEVSAEECRQLTPPSAGPIVLIALAS